ncbi:hypothetical protein ST47_g4905 [Ascochyta rabiei]|uniref:Uncharacterized protein n=1 Tax=Didymella rabiei TaxID=5454 RepID=A0A163EYS1_DIDRA|nr:hypothetical protein ST47_g4905 [Ascochyta rabiei]
MAVKDEFTLADFTRYARENFPGAFEIVADPSLYKFEANRTQASVSDLRVLRRRTLKTMAHIKPSGFPQQCSTASVRFSSIMKAIEKD